MSLYEKYLQHNSDVEKDTVNRQTKTQRNCDVIFIRNPNVRKNVMYLTLLEIHVFINLK